MSALEECRATSVTRNGSRCSLLSSRFCSVGRSFPFDLGCVHRVGPEAKLRVIGPQWAESRKRQEMGNGKAAHKVPPESNSTGTRHVSEPFARLLHKLESKKLGRE